MHKLPVLAQAKYMLVPKSPRSCTAFWRSADRTLSCRSVELLAVSLFLITSREAKETAAKRKI